MVKVRKPNDILRYGYRYLLSYPKMILPFMIYEAGVIVGQAVIVIAFLSLLSYFKAFNLIPKIVESIEARNFEALALPEIMQPILITLGIAGIAYMLIIIVFDSFVKAGLYPFLQKVLIEREVSTKYFLEEAFRNWALVFKTNMLIYFFAAIPLIPSLTLFYLSFEKIIAGSIEELGFSALTFIAGIFLALIIYLALVFAPMAASIDENPPLQSIIRSVLMAKTEVGAIILYFSALVAVTLVAIAVESAVESFYVTLGSLVSIVISLAINPILHLYLVAVYETHNNETLLEPLKARLTFKLMYTTLNKGLKLIRMFFTTKYGLIALTVTFTVFLIGFTLGYLTVDPEIRSILINSGIIVPGRLNPEFKVYNRIFLGLDIFFHNWRTSLSTAMSGIVYAIPSTISTLFNGYVIGVVYATINDPIKASAIILPHGILEIPAFLLASASGVLLGFKMIMFRRGKVSLEEVTIDLERTAIFIIGLSLVFLVAGIIESNVTPIIAEMAGWS